MRTRRLVAVGFVLITAVLAACQTTEEKEGLPPRAMDALAKLVGSYQINLVTPIPKGYVGELPHIDVLSAEKSPLTKGQLQAADKDLGFGFPVLGELWCVRIQVTYPVDVVPIVARSKAYILLAGSAIWTPKKLGVFQIDGIPMEGSMSESDIQPIYQRLGCQWPQVRVPPQPHPLKGILPWFSVAFAILALLFRSKELLQSVGMEPVTSFLTKSMMIQHWTWGMCMMVIAIPVANVLASKILEKGKEGILPLAVTIVLFFSLWRLYHMVKGWWDAGNTADVMRYGMFYYGAMAVILTIFSLII